MARRSKFSRGGENFAPRRYPNAPIQLSRYSNFLEYARTRDRERMIRKENVEERVMERNLGDTFETKRESSRNVFVR